MENKLKTITNLFEGNEIRSVWDSEKNDYYFSVVDVISILTESANPRDYWYKLKIRMTEEEKSEVSTKCRRFKLRAKDGKARETEVLDTKGILRLIESVPSPKAEPFKMWLAQVGSDRIDEVFDPEIAINRAIEYYRKKGYDDIWIEKRLKGILSRKKLTDVWKSGGITENYEYALLTNEIYKTWSGMKASEYKQFKGIRKESLRDNMTDIEVALADFGELTTRDIARNKRPQGLKENIKVAKMGGEVAKKTKEFYEEVTGNKAISKENMIGIRYLDESNLVLKDQ